MGASSCLPRSSHKQVQWPLLIYDNVVWNQFIISVHGEYRFSSLEMPPPATGDGRLRGLDICNYAEKFTDKFLIGKAKFHFETEVLNIERDEKGNWNVAVEDLATKSLRTLTFSRIILATGVSRTKSETIYLQSKSLRHEGMQQSENTRGYIAISRRQSAISWDCPSFFPVRYPPG